VAPFWDERRAAYAALAVALLLVLALVWVAWLRRGLVQQIALRASLEEQLVNAQKMESVGRLAGGVAHDFNNYLTVIIGYTALLLDKLPESNPSRMALAAIRDVSQKAAALTRQLLAFSRKQLLQPVPCNLNETLASARQTLLPLIGENIELVTRPAEAPGLVNIDPAQFFQVIVNLAVNARDAMPNGGRLTFETASAVLGADDIKTRDGLAPGQYVSLKVTDTGTGMDEQTRQHIFEPFFTTKEKGRGTGLGLAVAFGIVKQSGGHIEVSSKLGEGTSFCIYLPVAASSANAAPPAEMPGPPQPGGGVTVLVVEDREEVRTLIATGLRSYGYDVLTAASAGEAVDLLKTSRKTVRVLLTDLVMPRRSGRELAADVASRWPGIRVIYMSGHSEEILRESVGSELEHGYLQKPFTAADVAQAVRRALDPEAS
jgi:signal transduction histidine kinase/CheY-like chemotaxis protein